MIRYLVVAILPLICACCYTSETRDKRVRLAVFSNNERMPGRETETVAKESVAVAGVGAAAWMDSWLAAWGIAVPSVIEVFRQPAENITTNTLRLEN